MKKYLPAIIFMVVLLAVVGVLVFWPEKTPSYELDSFANCLTQKGAVMYGAYWCPHCQNEKKAFGDAFRLVSYVECTEETQKCLDADINGYPTWIFSDGYSPTGSPVQGQRFEGEQGLKRLSEISGCALPPL